MKMYATFRHWLSRRGRTFRVWSRRVNFSRTLAVLLGVALFGSGVATVASMFESLPVGSDLTTVTILLNIDLILALALGAVMARRMVRVWAQKRWGRAGSRLHIRLVILFSMVAVIPAILVAIFAGFFLNFGIESWFSDRVRTAVNESEAVARAYLREHQRNIQGDVVAMANDLNQAAIRARRDPRFFSRYVGAQAALRSLTETLVVDGNGRIIVRSGLNYSLEREIGNRENIQKIIGRLESGNVVMLGDGTGDRIRAGIKLGAYVDAYLFVGRFVEAQVLEHLSRTEGAANQYNQLERSRDTLQIKFLLVFVLVAVLLLLAAVWLGWSVATQLATPISNLIGAAERVRKGDITARVSDTAASDEIGTLSRAFNRMTSQLEIQQQGLIEANRELDERRRFTETVLEGVSAGVIGLDKEGNIHLPNRSASELLATELEEHVGKPLGDVIPELRNLLDRSRKNPHRAAHDEIALLRDGGERRLLAYIRAEQGADELFGFVVTFDDVTELLAAQRTAAWADVARRIAHEIKNPLTPIQLSAERLRRKYLNEIESDPEVFSACTETIVRQVEDIGRMVDEFSAFARMPRPDFRSIDLAELSREVFFLESNRYRDIDYRLDVPDESIYLRCDRQQVGRALTNILKNAAEAVTAVDAASRGDQWKGEIGLSLSGDPGKICLVVSDNGKGLPSQSRERLTEPYVTTRDGGTGLGLAIAKKVMEDHNGELLMQNGSEAGACVSLIFHPVGKQFEESGAAEDTDAETTTANTRIADGV